MLKENNTRKGFFEHADFIPLKEALPDYLKGFFTFAYKTGWRVSEIENLTWSQVDLAQDIVRLEAGERKNNEARTAYLAEKLKEVSTRQQEARKSNSKLIHYVFPNQEGNDLPPQLVPLFKLAFSYFLPLFDNSQSMRCSEE